MEDVQEFGPFLPGDEEAHASAAAPGVEVSEASLVSRMISASFGVARDIGKIVANGDTGEAIRESVSHLS